MKAEEFINIEEGLYCDDCGMPIKGEQVIELFCRSNVFKEYFCNTVCFKHYVESWY